MCANTCFSESDKDKNYFGKVDVTGDGANLFGMVPQTAKMFQLNI
jgi:hypothetical protein